MTLTKLELITLHRYLTRFKEYLQKHGISREHFKNHEALKVGPSHLHKSKAEHKQAVFALVTELSKALENVPKPDLLANQKQEIILQLRAEDLKSFLQHFPTVSIEPDKLDNKSVLIARKV